MACFRLRVLRASALVRMRTRVPALRPPAIDMGRVGFEPTTLGLKVQANELKRGSTDGNALQIDDFWFATECTKWRCPETSLYAHPYAQPSRGCVLLIDEASMAETRVLAPVLELVEQAKGRAILVGDPHQLSPAGAGCRPLREARGGRPRRQPPPARPLRAKGTRPAPRGRRACVTSVNVGRAAAQSSAPSRPVGLRAPRFSLGRRLDEYRHRLHRVRRGEYARPPFGVRTELRRWRRQSLSRSRCASC